MLAVVEEVHRPDDDELCGFVEPHGGQWRALTVFGAVLGAHEHRKDAWDQVLSEGLASLADRWVLRHGESGDEEIVCILEANATELVIARGYYTSLPGVPTLTLTTEQIITGEWVMRR